MRYVLNQEYILCGWKHLPFALMRRSSGKVVFFTKEQFSFLYQFSGKKDIDIDNLDQDKKEFLDKLIRENVIHAAAEGETRDLYYKEYKGIFKRNVQWSVTGKCNYRCRHCFQSAPEGVLGEPSLEQCIDIIDQMDRCGIRTVGITGGEPLIRSDFLEILDEICRREMTVDIIYTNGKLVDPELLDELEKRRMHPGFQISFDGVGCHDWMRGVQGAEESALSAFHLLRDRGFHTASSMVLCRENIGTIRETVKTLALAGCSSLKLQRAMPQGEWQNQEEHYLTVAETLQAYLDYLPLFKEDGCPINLQMEGFFAYEKEKDAYLVVADKDVPNDKLHRAVPCGVICSSLYIGPNGAVTPCMSMCGAAVEKQFPNLFKMPLEDILYESSYTKLTSKKVDYVIAQNEKCHTCAYRGRCCGGCRAMGTGQNCGDYFAADPVTCEMFRDGWIDRLYEEADRLFVRIRDREQEDRSSC